MPTPLRDMAPWRRRLRENGLTYGWLAERTEKSVDTVKAYAWGTRPAPADWIARAEAAIGEHERAVA